MQSCMEDPMDEKWELMIGIWFEALVGAVPAKYWKMVTMRAARVPPYDKFTLGQFFQAWDEMKNAGEAPGYLKV